MSAGREKPPQDDAAGIDETVAEEVADSLGDRLRNEYEELVKAPVPDRFGDLLKQLDAIPSEASQSSKATADRDAKDADHE